MTAVAAHSESDVGRRRAGQRHLWRRALLIGTPAAWIVVALLHPAPDDGTIFEDLSGVSGRWLGAGDASPLAAISSVALTTAVVGVSMTWRNAGAARSVWIPVLGGVLLNFHGAGPIPAVGLGALAYGMFAAERAGLMEDHGGDAV